METLRLSTDATEDHHFGCLVDEEDRLVGSAFGPGLKTVLSFLYEYSMRIVRNAPVRKSNWSSNEMVRLFGGSHSSRTIELRDSFTTRFQQQVYSLLREIPRGKITTYGLLSKKLQSSPRAVGQAIASNPFPLFVECHRVVNANLTIGNYGLCGRLNETGRTTKRALLVKEGVTINNDCIDSHSLWNPLESWD